MIKIFHCGDIHLDAPFSGVSPTESNRRRVSLLDRFAEMMRFANDNRADLVLIAGDLFDSGYTQPSTVKAVSELLKDLRCPVVITPGNHDPYDKESVYKTAQFSENVHIFSSEELSRIDFDEIGASVCGYAFTSNSHPERPLKEQTSALLSSKNVNILCAHTDIYTQNSTYAPISDTELEDSGFLYAALGHIHKTPAVCKFGDCYAAYCGFAEGRGFDECGAGGAWLVNINNSYFPAKVDVERVCVSQSRYEVKTVDITGAESDSTAASMIDKALADDPLIPSGDTASESNGQGNETVVRIILKGELPMIYSPLTGAIEKLLRSRCRVEITDRTLPIYDASYLEKDMTVKGEFYRMLLPMLSSGTAEEKQTAALALRYGLCAMSGQDIVIE